jgi:hypothetical protein
LLPFPLDRVPRLFWSRALASFGLAFAVAVVVPAHASPETSATNAPGDDVSNRAVPPEYSADEGPWFTISYHPSARERVERLIPAIGSARADLEWLLGRPLAGPISIRIAGLDLELPQLAGIDGADRGDFEDSTRVTERGGALVAAQRLVVLSAGPGVDGEHRDLEVSLRFQLARLALADALEGATSPDWFVEGFASTFAHEGNLKRSATLVGAVLGGSLPRVDELDARIGDEAVFRALAAEVAQRVIDGREGRGMQRWVAAMRSGETFEDALAAAGTTRGGLDREVRDRIGARVAWLAVLATALLVGAGLGVIAWLRRRRRQNARALARQLVQAPALELIDPLLTAEAEDPMIDPHVLKPSPTHVHHDGSWHVVH